MKKSTKTLLLLAAGIGGVVYLKRRSDAKAAAIAASAAQPALQTASAATPAEVVPDSALSGSSLSVPNLASRGGMGIFG